MQLFKIVSLQAYTRQLQKKKKETEDIYTVDYTENQQKKISFI